MEVLVTGATGFLGTALCRRLQSASKNVLQLNSKNADLTRQGSLEKVTDGKKFDVIFHLAAWTQAGDFCLYHPGEQWVINQQINTNVLAWWHQFQPQAKLIAMGTSCSYSPELELVESNYMAGQPIDSLYTYAMTKRMLYAGLGALNKQFGLNYLCLVPSTLYGPGYHTDGRQMHFIFDLIRKIIRGKLFDEPVILWGDGHQRRELVYVDDFVDITLKLAQLSNNDLINVGAGEEHSIREFSKLICDHITFDFEKIRFDTSKYVGAKAKCLSVAKLHSHLPTVEMTSLDSGISKTIDWFLANKAY